MAISFSRKRARLARVQVLAIMAGPTCVRKGPNCTAASTSVAISLNWLGDVSYGGDHWGKKADASAHHSKWLQVHVIVIQSFFPIIMKD